MSLSAAAGQLGPLIRCARRAELHELGMRW